MAIKKITPAGKITLKRAAPASVRAAPSRDDGSDDDGDDFPPAPLTQAGQALESSRDSGFDLSAAVGELIDNSYEAKARLVRIDVDRDDDGSITDLAVADDGIGIDPDALAPVLSLGYSSRYNSRDGLGRFGMGLKLASLSHAQRVEVYSKTADSPTIYRTYLDLERIKAGEQTELNVSVAPGWPKDFGHLMERPPKGARRQPFDSGTLVIWRKIDRLTQGGRFGDSVEERLQGLRKFVARAYRRFIANGLTIELEGETIWLHDPLFLLDTPRVANKFKGVVHASIIEEGDFVLDGRKVSWTVTLLPKQFRKVRGSGGRAGKGREDFTELYIPDNESKISILRNNREIYYDLVPKLYPGGKDKIDRYIGVEVEFPAALDEYFQVRNVKRGAEPVSKLREELRKALKKPIEAARKRIRDYWREVEQDAVIRSGDVHQAAHDIVEAYQVSALDGRANMKATADEVTQKFRDVIVDMGLDPDAAESEAAMKWLRESFSKRSMTIVDAGWAGKDLLDVEHLTGKVIVKINRRHPFSTSVLTPLRAMAEKEADDLDVTAVAELLRKTVLGIDLLLLGYAKAENMAANPEDDFGDLRSDWGRFSHGLLREAAKQEG